MTTDLSTTSKASAIESALMLGDLSKLNTDERLHYYKNTCESLGLNPLTKPFAFIQLNGKLQMYALKDCTEQLRKLHGVSIESCIGQLIDGIYLVTVYGRDKTGRADSATGAVSIEGLKGENKANAMLKAETKAKRRLTLSICGLGMLDETETETIPDAVYVDAKAEAPKALPEAPKKAPESHSEPPKASPKGKDDLPDFDPSLPDLDAKPLVASAASLEAHLKACDTQAGCKAVYAAWKLLSPTTEERSKGLSAFSSIKSTKKEA